jgi:hypothetical protein
VAWDEASKAAAGAGVAAALTATLAVAYLTPQAKQVATLLPSEATNREVAAELFIRCSMPRTRP